MKKKIWFVLCKVECGLQEGEKKKYKRQKWRGMWESWNKKIGFVCE